MGAPRQRQLPINHLGGYPEAVASERSVTVGGVQIGGGAPPVVQSMTLTKTHDVEATTAQIAGCGGAG
jgi:(E)-4-hydroxy-3-methylbut-2-enyl-diphosphate synthase